MTDLRSRFREPSLVPRPEAADDCPTCACADHGLDPCGTLFACSGRRCLPGHPGVRHYHPCLCPRPTPAPA